MKAISYWWHRDRLQRRKWATFFIWSDSSALGKIWLDAHNGRLWKPPEPIETFTVNCCQVDPRSKTTHLEELSQVTYRSCQQGSWFPSRSRRKCKLFTSVKNRPFNIFVENFSALLKQVTLLQEPNRGLKKSQYETQAVTRYRNANLPLGSGSPHKPET